MHSTVICPGSFDPVTLGHIDIITRASKMFDNVIVGVFVNGEKHPAFTIEERISFLERTVGDIPNVRVIGCDGLLAQCAKDLGATAVVRGLRVRVPDGFDQPQAQSRSRHGLSGERFELYLP